MHDILESASAALAPLPPSVDTLASDWSALIAFQDWIRAIADEGGMREPTNL